MAHEKWILNRRTVLTGIGVGGLVSVLPSSAFAQSLGLSSILGKATDNALDELAQPGAFYNDEDIRIGIPGVGNLGGSGKKSGGLMGSLMGAGKSLGGVPGLDDLVKGINDATGVAAGAAKPIFRDAIDGLSFNDVPDIMGKDDGATQYLRKSSSDQLSAQFNPLVDDALSEAGIHSEIEKISANNSLLQQAGIDRNKINQSVTNQGMDGIFSYIGKEEAKFRKDPIGNVGGALGGLIGN